MTNNNIVQNEGNPVVLDGDYIKMLRTGNSELELLQLAEFMEKFAEEGFQVVQSFYENMGIAPIEGTYVIIMQYKENSS